MKQKKHAEKEAGNLEKYRVYLRFAFSILICQFAGFIGSIFTTPVIPTWYASINKPSFNPPNWLFGPVWTTLFLMMGISLFLILNSNADKKKIKIASGVFAIQLLLNILWSLLFFGLHNTLFGFIEIILLCISILLTIIVFYRISKPAAYLLVPYILWVSFASVLNYSLMILN